MGKFDGTNEKAWLSKIATNKCLDYKKAASRKTIPVEETYFIGEKSTDLSIEEQVMEKEVSKKLLEVCNQLKAPYNQIAREYFYEEKTVVEMAERSGKNIKTLQTQIYRAKAMLRKLWKEEK